MAETCTKRVPVPCSNEAVNVLCVREPGGEWEFFYRCAEHPASEDVAMLRRVSPLAEVEIEPVEDGQ